MPAGIGVVAVGVGRRRCKATGIPAASSPETSRSWSLRLARARQMPMTVSAPGVRRNTTVVVDRKVCSLSAVTVGHIENDLVAVHGHVAARFDGLVLV